MDKRISDKEFWSDKYSVECCPLKLPSFSDISYDLFSIIFMGLLFLIFPLVVIIGICL